MFWNKSKKPEAVWPTEKPKYRYAVYLTKKGIITTRPEPYSFSIYGSPLNPNYDNTNDTCWYAYVMAESELEAADIIRSRLEVATDEVYETCELGKKDLAKSKTYKIPTNWGTVICSRGHSHDLGEWQDVSSL